MSSVCDVMFVLTVQGFPVQTVMNHGTPLLLNLQPGQTVQPLTLIQCRTPQVHHTLINKKYGLIIVPGWSDHLSLLFPVPTAPSLGQLVRPSVGVSPVLPQGQAIQTRPGPAPSRGPAQPGSAFTAMQLPATLTIRTSTPGPGQSDRTYRKDQTDWGLSDILIDLFFFFPVNLQMTQVGRANSLKLTGSPALPSGSANGVRITPFSSSTSKAIIIIWYWFLTIL